MNIGIYKIINPEGKVYVGQSTNIEKRKKTYKGLACKNQRKLYNSLKKYGWEKHIFEMVEECSVGDLDEKETYWKQYYLNKVNNDWNMVLFLALHDKGGGPKQQHTKDLMSVNIKKAKQNITPERAKEIGNNISLGQNSLSEEAKEQWSINISLGQNSLSEEAKKQWGNKIADAKRGHECYNNPERGVKISDANNITVIQKDKNNNIIKIWDSMTKASEGTGVNIGSISMCVNGKLKTAGGFKWEKIKR